MHGRERSALSTLRCGDTGRPGQYDDRRGCDSGRVPAPPAMTVGRHQLRWPDDHRGPARGLRGDRGVELVSPLREQQREVLVGGAEIHVQRVDGAGAERVEQRVVGDDRREVVVLVRRHRSASST